VAARERTIGVIVTGMLDDGTAGMYAIKKCGGRLIIQDPREADYPEMPQSVLDKMEVDYILPLSEMGNIIKDIIDNNEPIEAAVPPEIQAEAQIAERMASAIDETSVLGKHSLNICPDCGGPLWELVEDNRVRYRCHIGHAYTETEFVAAQAQKVESALWSAIRLMEERKNVLNKIAIDEDRRGLKRMAESHFERVREIERNIDTLKAIIFPGEAQVNIKNEENSLGNETDQ
jgi:two-component system chemotaxis response regulator CheB